MIASSSFFLGPEAECVHHPGNSVFYEGSKGNKNVNNFNFNQIEVYLNNFLNY